MDNLYNVIGLAFDIGSGAVKVSCKRGEKKPNSCEGSDNGHLGKLEGIRWDTDVIFGKEKPFLLGARVVRAVSLSHITSGASGDVKEGKPLIPQDVIEDLILEIRGLVCEALEAAAAATTSSFMLTCRVEAKGVCTAVFRNTSNGPDVVKRIKEDTGVQCELVSQENEALLGYLTAAAVKSSDEQTCKGTSDQLISWDSGGASFQLCTKVVHTNATEGSKFMILHGHWGSSSAHEAFLKHIKGASKSYIMSQCWDEEDENPCSMVVVEAFSQELFNDLNDPARHCPKEIDFFRKLFAAKENSGVYCLKAHGGPSCAFSIAWQLLQRPPIVECQALFEKVILPCSSMSKQEIIELSGNPELPQAYMAMSKCILIYTVMKFLGISGYCFGETVGNTLALFDDSWYFDRMDLQMKLLNVFKSNM